MSLKGKYAIVTGANRGIGLATVRLFAQKGCNIWACARKQTDCFENTLADLAVQYGVIIKPVYFELTNIDEVKNRLKEVFTYNKHIDILVNCAGISYSGDVLMTSIEKLKEVFEVNYFAQINLIQVVSRIMIRQKAGSIVHVASVRGLCPIAGSLAYASSKSALICATQVLSKDLSNFGIRVNAVAPSLTDTDMGNNRKHEDLERIIAHTALKRMANPEEVASAIAYLASDDASFINGEVLTIDGGQI